MKMHLLKRKQICALILAVVMSMSLIACGSKPAGQQNSDNVTEAVEFVYVPEYIEMENADEMVLYSMQILGNSMYFFNYSFDEETLTSTTALCEYSFESGQMTELPAQIPEERSVNNFRVDDAGNLYTVEYQWMENENTFESTELYFLCKYDAQGNSVLNQEISDIVKKDDEYAYVNAFTTDAQGRYYLSLDDTILLFDENGQHKGEIVNDDWIQGMGTDREGKVYITAYDSSSAGGCLLKELSFESKSIGQSYQNFPGSNGNGTLVSTTEGKFLVNDGSRLYEYDKETQEAGVLLTWLDCDINGTYVNNVGVLSDGRILAVINDWNTGETEMAYLTQKSASEVPVKTPITIGTLYDNQQLQAAAVAFNKTNDTYRINIKTYMDSNNWSDTSWQDAINNMNSDIVSGSNCPDILDLSGLNIEQLASKGVFDDLTPYMEKSTILNKEDFVESVVNAYTFDGKLVCVPSTFSLITVAGKASEVGEEMGWTLEEMMAYAQEHTDAMVFDYAAKSDMLYYLLSFNQKQFVDWTTGECKFDSDEFVHLLEFANRFPDEYSWTEEQASTPVKLQAGEVLLYMADVYDFESIQQYDAMFDEQVTFIGYPNAEGNSGCYLTGEQMYAIASKSQNKDAAWTFIESCLAEGASDMYSFGFPSKKADLEKQMEEVTKVEYLTDENGEVMLDEEGNPIILNGGGSVGYGDWEYTYHVVTQEEADRVMELIRVAQPVFIANDEIIEIVNEEAEAFFKGKKSAEDVAGIIQSRVKVYVSENM